MLLCTCAYYMRYSVRAGTYSTCTAGYVYMAVHITYITDNWRIFNITRIRSFGNTRNTYYTEYVIVFALLVTCICIVSNAYGKVVNC